MGEYQQRTIVQLRKDLKKAEAEIERLKADLLTVAESKVSIRAEGMEQAAVIADKSGRHASNTDIATAIRARIKP